MLFAGCVEEVDDSLWGHGNNVSNPSTPPTSDQMNAAANAVANASQRTGMDVAITMGGMTVTATNPDTEDTTTEDTTTEDEETVTGPDG